MINFFIKKCIQTSIKKHFFTFIFLFFLLHFWPPFPLAPKYGKIDIIVEYLFVSLTRGTFVHLSPAFQVPFPSPHPPTMVTRKRWQAVKPPLLTLWVSVLQYVRYPTQRVWLMMAKFS
jgi:hypothetical protein